MEQIRMTLWLTLRSLPRSGCIMPPIILTIEAESPRGTLAPKFAAVALQELLARLRSLELAANAPLE
jgi:hypothetical protein